MLVQPVVGLPVEAAEVVQLVAASCRVSLVGLVVQDTIRSTNL